MISTLARTEQSTPAIARSQRLVERGQHLERAAHLCSLSPRRTKNLLFALDEASQDLNVLKVRIKSDADWSNVRAH